MDRTISSLSNPSPPNSISTSSSSWSPTYSSSSRANKIGAFLLAVSVVRVRSEMNYTNYAKKNVQRILEVNIHKTKYKSPKFNKMSKRQKYDLTKKIFFIKTRCKFFFRSDLYTLLSGTSPGRGDLYICERLFPCIKD